MDILFPHDEMRNIQDRMVSDIEKGIKNRKNMLVHAPTGIGKTAAALGAVLKYAIDSNKVIFFGTSKHTQHKIAIETLKKIREKFSLDFGVADFIGKKWMCLMPGTDEMYPSEFYDYCKEHVEAGTCDYYTKSFDKHKPSIHAIVALEELKKSAFSVEEEINICKKHGLCPYEVAMFHAKNARVIVADYFHILNSSIRENFLKRIKRNLNEIIIIMDEGHNLPERCRDLLSSQVSLFTVEKAEREIRQAGDGGLADNVNKIKDVLLELNRRIGLAENERLVSMNEFQNAINAGCNYNETVKRLRKIGEVILEEKKRSFANQLAGFLEMWPGPDEGFTRILKRGFSRKDKLAITLNYRCLDPSVVLKPIAENATVIAMSGTLRPGAIYKNLFGFEAELREYEDPFPQKNRLNMIVPGITTKFSERDSEMYRKISKAAANITNNVPGNSIIFFPSYQLINSVYENFRNDSDKTIFMERPKLSKEDKETIIENFKKYKDHGAVLMACASGSFGEGIDLPGDYLKSVLIVGLPLAKPDLETKETIKYYDRKFNNGWDYGYIFPALIKCIQNAGRCIRSETDRGVIVFLDARYCMDKYKKFFPAECDIKITSDPVPLINEFFGDKKVY